jgi:hypothetical protein
MEIAFVVGLDQLSIPLARLKDAADDAEGDSVGDSERADGKQGSTRYQAMKNDRQLIH